MVVRPTQAQLQELLTAKVRTEKVVHKDAKIRTFIQEDCGSESRVIMGCSNCL